MTNIEFAKMEISKKRSEKRKPRIEDRVKTFNIKESMTVIDYGCGPGMYICALSKTVGENGKVFAVDVLEIAKETVEKIVLKNKINNVQFFIAKGYNSKLNEKIADVVIALDIFHGIENSNKFLMELYRICKDDGMLIIDDGHQPRKKTKESLEKIIQWKIIEETKDHIKCKKI